MAAQIRVVWRGEMLLGEGPVWDERSQCLWFVDIKQCRVHRYDPATERVTGWETPAPVGWVVPSTDGALVAGLQTGLASFDPLSGSFEHIATVEPDRPGNRLNDAIVGPDGAIWFGSMDDAERDAVGYFYRFDGHRVVRTTIDPVPVTNGPAFSPDGQTLYHVDTLGGIIYAAPVGADGAIGVSRRFAQIAPEQGNPDGVTVDAAGNVWVGLWGGWCARCYASNGTLVEELRLPTANVTKIAFGGRDLRTAYVTTARIGLSSDALVRQPEAGSLFCFDVDVCGQVPQVATRSH